MLSLLFHFLFCLFCALSFLLGEPGQKFIYFVYPFKIRSQFYWSFSIYLNLYFTYFLSLFFLPSTDFGDFVLTLFLDGRFIWEFSLFWRKACIAIHFPLRLTLLHPTDFCKVMLYCLFSQGIFWFSLWFHHWPSGLCVCFFSSRLFSFHMILYFSFFFLWLISSFIILWLKRYLEISSTLLNMLRLLLWPSI